MTQPDTFHFFGASYCTWVTTDENRDLPALIDLLNAEGNTYNLFMVPIHHAVPYNINFYRPVVEGVIHLGTFEPKKKRTRKAA
jgi:hypothetical protein